jgi:hypothetical protein
MVFNATFNNISVILWWSDLLVEKTNIKNVDIKLSATTVLWTTLTSDVGAVVFSLFLLNLTMIKNLTQISNI